MTPRPQQACPVLWLVGDRLNAIPMDRLVDVANRDAGLHRAVWPTLNLKR